MQTAEMSSVENTQIPHDECEFPLVFTEKGKYKWQGDFAALQKFTEEVLKMKGKWSTPGGNAKLLKTEELALRWYRSSNNITINGLKADEIGKQLELYATNATNITENLDENHLYSNEIGIHPTTNDQACKTPYLINNERL